MAHYLSATLAFMIATMLSGDPDPKDVREYFRALRSATSTCGPSYTRHYRTSFRSAPSTRWTHAAGGQARIVFEPYTKEAFDDSFKWIREHGIFESGAMGSGRNQEARVSTG
jgi:hypothetical protein